MKKELDLFLESCRSEQTKKQYSTYLKKWIEFNNSELSFDSANRKSIEDKIIEFIISLKKQVKSRAAIRNYIEPICSLYTINDIILNRRRINKFYPENRKVKSDRAYTHEEISELLKIADERMRCVILILASSGVRIGAITSLRLRHLQNYKLTVYEGSNEEYFTFITPECKRAIDFYLDMRSRYGEKLNANSILIREQFDVRIGSTVPRQITKVALQLKLYDLCKRCGIENENIAIAHGFRKFFMNQCVNSKINPEIREMMLGHDIGLASAYYRPTQEEMYTEYEKAVNNLTINEENRLQIKIESLESENSEIEKLRSKVAEMEPMYAIMEKHDKALKNINQFLEQFQNGT